MKVFWKRKKKHHVLIDPEDIFSDSVNLPGFRREDQEGAIESSLERWPFFLIGLFLFLGLGGLLTQLVRLEVVRGDEFRKRAAINQFRITYASGARGVIYDENGKKIATNIPVFSATLRKSFIKDPEQFNSVLARLGGLLGVTPADLLWNLGVDPASNPFMGLPDEVLLYSNLPLEAVIEIKSHREDFPGIAVDQKYSRDYPYGEALSHILGFTGRAQAKDAAKGYSLGDTIGKDGIEAEYEGELRGEQEKNIIEVDAFGRTVAESRLLKGGNEGGSLELNIDAELQSYAYEVLKNSVAVHNKKGGAVVVSDPRDGSIKVLVSFPSYDNNMFRGGVSKKEMERVRNDKRFPFLNRAIAGGYPSGSSIKPVMAAAALQERIIDPLKQIFDPGYIEVQNPYNPDQKSIFKDWKALGYVDMREALAWSANVYFFIIGGGYQGQEGLGIARIKKYAGFFGFGSELGIDLPGEIPGLMPDPEWKKKNLPKDPFWRVGDTYNTSIGQGYVQVTPLQINFATAAIANGGKLLRPRIAKAVLDSDKKVVREFPAVVVRENFVDPQYLEIVREGMRRVVTTGSAQALNGVVVSAAGKTGTAQTETGVYEQTQNHAWFTGFAPYENPEIAITVFVEKGGGGATVSVPIAEKILNWYFLRKLYPAPATTTPVDNTT